MVPQDFALYCDLTAAENISYFCSLYGFKGKELKERTLRTLEFVGLSEVKDKKAGEFSGGMKRRLNIGCAIAYSPRPIIMDEPTVGIDPQSRSHILQSVLKLSKKIEGLEDLLKEIAGIEKVSCVDEDYKNLRD